MLKRATWAQFFHLPLFSKSLILLGFQKAALVYVPDSKGFPHIFLKIRLFA